MGTVAKYYLGGLIDTKKRFDEQVTNIFLISEQITLVDKLCSLISKKINSDVYWYKLDDKAMICVINEYVDVATKCGKEVIINELDTMSANYINNDKTIPVLDEYSVIATVDTDNLQGLKNWVEKLDPDHELLVKIFNKEQICILTKEPDDFRAKIMGACISNPLGGRPDFDFHYWKI